MLLVTFWRCWKLGNTQKSVIQRVIRPGSCVRVSFGTKKTLGFGRILITFETFKIRSPSLLSLNDTELPFTLLDDAGIQKYNQDSNPALSLRESLPCTFTPTASCQGQSFGEDTLLTHALCYLPLTTESTETVRSTLKVRQKVNTSKLTKWEAEQIVCTQRVVPNNCDISHFTLTLSSSRTFHPPSDKLHSNPVGVSRKIDQRIGILTSSRSVSFNRGIAAPYEFPTVGPGSLPMDSEHRSTIQVSTVRT
jgi:hypothetical protein